MVGEEEEKATVQENERRKRSRRKQKKKKYCRRVIVFFLYLKKFGTTIRNDLKVQKNSKKTIGENVLIFALIFVIPFFFLRVDSESLCYFLLLLLVTSKQN